MAPNSYKPWSDEDVLLLENLYQYGAHLDAIARALNRTPRAIEHGIKHMLIQQSMYYGVEAVAEKFKLTPEIIYRDLAPPKYYPVDREEEELPEENQYQDEEDIEPTDISFCSPSIILGTAFLAYFAVALYGYINPLTL